MYKIFFGPDETKFGPSMQWIDTSSRFSLEKIASVCPYIPPTLATKIAELQKTLTRDKVAFYNRAVPAFESFGSNRNGDAFHRSELMAKHATFVEHGHYYQGHVNKDPSIAKGRPVASAFNEETDMVDLVIVADADKVQDRIHLLEKGEKVATSMGCKVAFDVCSICGNQAPTRASYCEHVKEAAAPPFGMNAVLDDGRVCCVFNPNPRFFDISDVGTGAAAESEHLMKVASFGIPHVVSSAWLAEQAGLRDRNPIIGILREKNAKEKSAEIMKEIPLMEQRISQAPLESMERRIPSDVLQRVRERIGAARMIRHISALGIVLRPREFSIALGMKPISTISRAAVEMADPLTMEAFEGPLDPAAMAQLEPWFAERSSYMPALYNRITGAGEVRSPGEIAIPSDSSVAALYAGYRKSLPVAMSVPDLETEKLVCKCAGTAGTYFPEFSRAYASAAYLVGPHSEKVASACGAEDNGSAGGGPLSGTMADDLGQEVLSEMADQEFANKLTRSRV